MLRADGAREAVARPAPLPADPARHAHLRAALQGTHRQREGSGAAEDFLGRGRRQRGRRRLPRLGRPGDGRPHRPGSTAGQQSAPPHGDTRAAASGQHRQGAGRTTIAVTRHPRVPDCHATRAARPRAPANDARPLFQPGFPARSAVQACGAPHSSVPLRPDPLALPSLPRTAQPALPPRISGSRSRRSRATGLVALVGPDLRDGQPVSEGPRSRRSRATGSVTVGGAGSPGRRPPNAGSAASWPAARRGRQTFRSHPTSYRCPLWKG